MTRKIDIYIWKELLVPFLIGTVAVAMMFSINQLMYIMKNISVQAVPREAILQSLLFRLPYWLNMTLPVGVALAASLAFTRFTRESELTAMRAAGTPILRVVLPVAVFGLMVGLGNYLLVEKVMPPAEKRFNTVANKIGMLGVLPEFRSNAVIYLKDYTASFGTVARAPGDVLNLYDVLLIQRPKPGEINYYRSESGTYDKGHWQFKNAYWTQFKDDELVVAKANGGMTIDERIVVENLLNPPGSESKTSAELRRAIDTDKRIGNDTRSLEVAYYTRWSVPAACVIFAAVAPIFAVLFARTGGFAGVLLSIFLVMLYYNVFIVSTEIFGKNGWLNPIASAWLPNVIFAALGLLALRRLE